MTMKTKFIALIFSVFLASCKTVTPSQSRKSNVKNSFQEKALLLSEKENKYLDSVKLSESENKESDVKLSFSLKDKEQKVDLFGGALTHASAHLILQIQDKDARKEFLEDIFQKHGFNCIRIPIGSSDFHSEDHFFSCLDEVTDKNNPLKSFTLKHDRELIQVIREILEIRKDLKIIAASWSAPEFMKAGSRISSKDPNGPKLCGGTLKDDYINLYSDYLALFVDSYQELGIKIDYLSLQNEPTYNKADYPCMLLTSNQAKKIAKRLHSILPEETKLLAYDHNTEDVMYSYLEDEFEDEEAAACFDAVAIHGYGSQPLYEGTKNLKQYYPDKNVYMTEITEWDNKGNFSSNLMYMAKNTTQKAINNGLSGTIYWNLCLTKDGGPCMGQNSTCYGLIDIDRNEGGSIRTMKRSGFYGLGIFASILDITEDDPAYRLKTYQSDSSLLFSAFEKKEGYCFIVTNPTSEKLSFSLSYGFKDYSYDLESSSMIGFTLKKQSDKISL